MGKLEHVFIGCRVHIPDGAFERFVELNKVTPCQERIADRNSNGFQTVGPSTSLGLKGGAASSAALTLRIAEKLKQPSPKRSKSEGSGPAQVIRLKS
jgi:hypothetical protein